MMVCQAVAVAIPYAYSIVYIILSQDVYIILGLSSSNTTDRYTSQVK